MLPVEAGGPGVKWLRTMSKMTEAEARIMKSGISDKFLDQPDPTSCCWDRGGILPSIKHAAFLSGVSTSSYSAGSSSSSNSSI